MSRAVIQRSATDIAMMLKFSGLEEGQDGILTLRADHFLRGAERVVAAAWLAASIGRLNPDSLALVAGDRTCRMLRSRLAGGQHHGDTQHAGNEK